MTGLELTISSYEPSHSDLLLLREIGSELESSGQEEKQIKNGLRHDGQVSRVTVAELQTSLTKVSLWLPSIFFFLLLSSLLGRQAP